MDYLRQAVSLTQLALAKGSGIPNLPNFGLGDRKSEYDGLSIWTLYSGTKRDDDSEVSIFVYDSYAPSSSRADKRITLQLAKNALKKLRALRHPDILRYIDGSETDSAVYIVTEPVVPLTQRIGREGDVKPTSESAIEAGTGEEWRVWGLSRVVNALGFINDSGQSTHGNLRVSSIFVTPSGEWRLGGFEVLTLPKDGNGILYTHGGFLPDASRYAPPEVQKSGYDALKSLQPHVLDAYHLFLFLHVLFNGPLPFMSSPSDIPTSRGAIPPNVFPHARRLYTPNGNPNTRLKPFAFYALGTAQDPPGFFRTNRLVTLAESLDTLSIAGDMERAALVSRIKDSLDGKEKLPVEFATWKVLPALIKAFEFAAGGPQLLPLIISLGDAAKMPATDYDKFVLQPVIRAFASPDRAMRMALLEALPGYVDKLDKKVVTDKVWPHLVCLFSCLGGCLLTSASKLTGFVDIVPVIREATVKSILLIAPKLTDRILNNDLLRHLAKTQMDVEPGIRTNTCILLGRLSKFLQPATNVKVLIPAFSRAVRDPFVHARIAGLMSLMSTIDVFGRDDIAGKVIPAISITLVDKEKIVRDQAFKTMDTLVKKLQAMVASMPETVATAPASGSNGVSSTPSSQVTLPSTNGAGATSGAAGALAGWAISSFAKRLAPAELQTAMGAISAVSAVTAPSAAAITQPKSALQGTVTSSSGLAFGSTSTPTSKPLVLGHTTNSSTDKALEGWGDDDLMNVEGQDDWDALEAPDNPWDDIADDTPVENLFSTTTSAPKRPGVTPPLPLASNKMRLEAKRSTPDALLTDTASTPVRSHQVKTTAPGWNDPPPAIASKPASTGKPKPRVSRPSSAAATFAPPKPVTAEEGWDAFDASSAPTTTSVSTAAWNATPVNDDWDNTSKSTTSSTASSGAGASDAKSKVAKMREERKAKMAALKANAATPSSAPPASSFTSGAQTAYRF